MNFAVALSRISGLPIEFSYLYEHNLPIPTNEELDPSMLCGLSVVDADANSYRPEGIYRGDIIVPAFDLVAQARMDADPALQHAAMSGRLSIGARIIEEQCARSLGLLVGEDAGKIAQWMQVIPTNRAYFKTLPMDLSLAPVHAHIMRYAHHECHFYAYALAQATEGTPMMFSNEAHSLVNHGDFLLEDVWGYRDPVKVSIQYGARSPDELSAQKFNEMIAHFRWKLGSDFQRQIDHARRVVDMRLQARQVVQAPPTQHQLPSGP